MKMNSTLLAFCVVACLSICEPSNADEIYNNGDLDIDIWCGSFVGENTGVQNQVAEDFVLPSGNQWVVNGASWVGTFFEFQTLQQTVGLSFNFDLLVFEDNNGMPTGLATDPIPGTAIAHRQLTIEGTEYLPDVPTIAAYEASFDPIVLEGGTSYWFSVVASGDFTLELENLDGSWWGWAGERGAGNSHGGGNLGSGSGEWSLINEGQGGVTKEFSLFGTAIPEPSSTALLGVCLIAGWMRRRR